MGQGTARWIAIALVAALVATLAVGLLGGRGDPPEDAAGPAGGRSDAGVASEPLEGPHVVAFLCAGQECPRPDADAEQAILAELESDPRVLAARLVTREQAYQLFLDRFGDQEELVASVDPEQIPARVELDLVDPDGVDQVLADHQGREGIAAIEDARVVAP